MTAPDELTVGEFRGPAVEARFAEVRKFQSAFARLSLGRDPAWLGVLHRAFGHEPILLEARHSGGLAGFVLLSEVSSLLFGRFLVSLPYLNSNGVEAADPEAAVALADAAVRLARRRRVRSLELRHETAVRHPALEATRRDKVHMRLELPATDAALWSSLNAKVRNQIRKGEKGNFSVEWGRCERLLRPFHAVLAENMRDLGTPVYGDGLFRAILHRFPAGAELCVVRDGAKPIAGALLLHGRGVTEVPTASSLRAYNPANVNMLMYYHLLRRAVERRQGQFDFGRSTAGGPTFQFKKQWGAKPHPAAWQCYGPAGGSGEVRPDDPRYGRAVALWKRLPLGVTRAAGPLIVRGIP